MSNTASTCAMLIVDCRREEDDAAGQSVYSLPPPLPMMQMSSSLCLSCATASDGIMVSSFCHAT